MSISSYTTVTMLDSRPAPITISVPKSTDITNRIITFKDLYGSASNSTVTLVTQSGDTFEDGTFSTIMSNAYQTVNLYAGLPGRWLNVGATGGGGDSAGLTTVSNLLNSVSTHVTTISTNLNTVSNTGATNTTNLNTVSNHLNALSTNLITVSTNLNTVSNVLTGVSTTVAAGRFPAISTTTISTNLVRAGYISSPQGYISSLIVDSLAFSLSNSFIVMGDIITTSVSTIQTFTSSLTTNNLRVGTVSSLNFIAFSGLQQGYAQTVIAEQSTGTGIQELLLFRGSTTTDRIRMQTTGPIVFEPGVSARVFPNASSNVTPAMIITTGSNVGIGVAAPTVALDVAGVGRFTGVSTNTISTNQINSSNICNAGWISNGGILSNITAGAFFQATSNTTTLGVAGIATFASNITQTAGTTVLAGFSVNTISTNQINSSNICNAGWFSNNGVLSNITAEAFFQATSNTTTLGVAGIATFASNITQTAGTTTLTGVSTTTISTNTLNAGYLVGKFPGTLAITSVSPLSLTNGTDWNVNGPQIEFQHYSGGYRHFIGSRHAGGYANCNWNSIDFWLYSSNGGNSTASTTPGTGNVNILSVTANGVGICNNSPLLALDVVGGGRITTLSTNSISTGTILANTISTNSISTGTLTVGGSAISPRLVIQSNATLTDPASVIITIPNTSYFYADYTNLTNYITISNYGAQNGDYINIVNTGNSGAPATFQILDGSTGASTIIRYIYPGVAGVVAYSSSQWWPL